CRRHPRGHRTHRRWRPCPRRRRCWRSHDARVEVKKVVPFTKACERSIFGSTAVGLSDAARQGLPVPPGVALSGDLVEAVASGDDKAIEKLAKAIAALPPPFAVRSSAVDEDSAAASFAGQHLTLLNVHSAADVPGAVREVWWSANSDSAITYRQRVGLFTRPSVGVVVQRLLNPTAAGGRPGARRHRPARRHGIPWPPFSASSASPISAGGRPHNSPACFGDALARRARPASWRAPEAAPSSA